jgi:hypothetical protein
MSNTNLASDKQLYWIVKLVDEKTITEELRAEIRRGIKRNDITKKDASRFLDALFAAQSPVAADAVTEAGFYAYENKVYRVKAAKSTGNLYAQLVTAHGFNYEAAKGMMKVLKAAMKMTGEQIAAYGQKTGICANCSALLTDPASIAIGLGTVCGPKILGKEAYKASYKAAATPEGVAV